MSIETIVDFLSPSEDNLVRHQMEKNVKICYCCCCFVFQTFIFENPISVSPSLQFCFLKDKICLTQPFFFWWVFFSQLMMLLELPLPFLLLAGTFHCSLLIKLLFRALFIN